MMNHLGEIISLVVAASWTITAWFAAKASLRVGAMVTNVLRLVMTTVVLAVLLWVTVGRPYPVYADGNTWLWLGLFGPVLGVSLSLTAVRYANAGIASTLMALTPVFIIVPEVLIEGKRIRFKEIAGLAVSIAGVALFFLL